MSDRSIRLLVLDTPEETFNWISRLAGKDFDKEIIAPQIYSKHVVDTLIHFITEIGVKKGQTTIVLLGFGLGTDRPNGAVVLQQLRDRGFKTPVISISRGSVSAFGDMAEELLGVASPLLSDNEFSTELERLISLVSTEPQIRPDEKIISAPMNTRSAPERSFETPRSREEMEKILIERELRVYNLIQLRVSDKELRVALDEFMSIRDEVNPFVSWTHSLSHFTQDLWKRGMREEIKAFHRAVAERASCPIHGENAGRSRGCIDRLVMHFRQHRAAEDKEEDFEIERLETLILK